MPEISPSQLFANSNTISPGKLFSDKISPSNLFSEQPRGDKIAPANLFKEEDQFGLSPKEIGEFVLEHNMVLNVFRGLHRITNEFITDPQKAQENFRKSAGDFAEGVSRFADFQNFKQQAGGLISGLVTAFAEQPKKTTGTLIKAILADPELLFVPPMVAAKVGKVAGTVAEAVGPTTALGKTFPPLAKGLAHITTGAGLGAGVELAEQFKKGEYDPDLTKLGATFGMGLSAAELAAGASIKRFSAIARGKELNQPKSLIEAISEYPEKTFVIDETAANAVTKLLRENPYKMEAVEIKYGKLAFKFKSGPKKGEYADLVVKLKMPSWSIPIKPADPKNFVITSFKDNVTIAKGISPVKQTIAKDKRYASVEQAKEVLEKGTRIAGQRSVGPVPKGKQRFYAQTADPTKRNKFVLLTNKPTPMGSVVDLTPGEVSILTATPDGFLLPKKHKAWAKRKDQSLIEDAGSSVFARARDIAEHQPQNLYQFLAKSAPPAILSGALVTGLALALYDLPLEHSIFGGLGTGIATAAWIAANRKPSGVRAITEAMADMNGYANTVKYQTTVFKNAADFLVGEEGLKRIFASYDKAKTVNLSPEELFVKEMFERNLFAILRAHRRAGFETPELFADSLPIHIVTEKGKTARGGEFKLKGIDNFDDLNARLAEAGLELRTKNIIDVLNYAHHNLYEKIINKRLIDHLANEVHPVSGLPLAKKSALYRDYESISRAPGYVFHRDIVEPMKFLLSPKTFESEWQRTVLGYVSFLKRTSVSYSLFHAKTLYDGMIGATGLKGINPSEMLKRGYDTILGKQDSPTLRMLIRKGLVLGNQANEIDIDAMNKVILDLGKKMDNLVPGGFGTKTAEKISEFNAAIDTFTFGYVQNSFKVMTALTEFEKLIAKGVDIENAARMAASYANDIYGGQNWFRLLNESMNQTIRNFGNRMLAGGGFGWMRILLFAPDWKFSTVRSLYKAFPGVAEKDLQILHAKYILRSAIYYAAVANTVNLLMTGHHFWENHDPTRVQIGTGPTGNPIYAHINKHGMELPDFVKNPQKFILGAINPPVKMPFEFLMDQQYMTTKGGPELVKESDSLLKQMGSVFAKILSPMVPISMQHASDPVNALFGFYGIPIEGAGAEETLRRREEGRRERRVDRYIARLQKMPESLNAAAIRNMWESLVGR